MKENFSKGVQRVLKYAKEEAVRLGHSYVGSEHLLLGIIKDSNGRAGKILTSIGCDIAEMKSMIEDMAKPSGGTMTLGHLPLTRRAERILRTTFAEAQNFNEEVADVFPDMILRSVPGYPLTISMISIMADKFYQSGSNIYDLGCSLGTVSIAIQKVLKDRKSKIIAVDNSEAMIKFCCKNRRKNR